ncbi:helix-turn-helix transcriptional regulator [Actinospica sp. MGRD01-02]|uniref:Helix-turn-helix transcriptional regulator n=1 Tax=Actinospica acidithermotolerans TaxID=2828514 RepID=A0A941E7D5_9ACTN|nr:helix-turn-helix transcriptional regulator [Actinospica acidithermotolerans]MBR7825827.1 helix-turn-helix transcriptional regulator [Actinospica acidithermotolerans]
MASRILAEIANSSRRSSPTATSGISISLPSLGIGARGARGDEAIASGSLLGADGLPMGMRLEAQPAAGDGGRMSKGRREALAKRRRACGISQEELAALLNVDPRTVGRWEAGAAEPQPWLRPHLARILALTLEELDSILIAADEEPIAGHLVVFPADPVQGPYRFGVRPAEGVASALAVSIRQNDPSAVLADAEYVRALAERSLVSASASHEWIDQHADVFEWRKREYCRNPPLKMLALLLGECREVQEVASHHHPAAIQRRLSALTSNYATLIADALMKVGEQRHASNWYSTATAAADDTGDALLRAQARAQAAMLPYYYGRVAEALRLTREAQMIARGRTGSPVALAAAGEARALARLGNSHDAEDALRRCQEAFEHVGEPDDEVAFRFTERRLMLYLSGTLTNLGETRRASEIQHGAQMRYGADGGIDPVLIDLDQAICLVLDGAPADGCQLAQEVLSSLPEQQRTGVVLARTSDLLAVVPDGHSSNGAVTQLRETLALLPGN